ncbi:MAG: cytochrome-c peroxidase [Gemmatimonadetes bacterium]|nr:cytochrome-c peroxidase [Gemmatimonadota bacterium]
MSCGRKIGVLAAVMAAGTPFAVDATAQRPALSGRPEGLDLYLPVPPDNPLRVDVISLGRRLFFDPILSRDSSLACSSCHQPQRGFTDGRRVSVGVFGRQGTRNVPAILNRGYGRSFFWDGRITSLEVQVLQPIRAPNEMDLSVDEAVARVRSDPTYSQRFRSAFSRQANAEDLARALASYIRTIQAGASRFDRLVGGDASAMTEVERQGLALFQGKARCDRCHVGTNLTDENFHNTGVAWSAGQLHDLGRFVVSGAEQERGAFKTPTLREVERTAPYMHDGSIATLEEVIEFYDRGGNANPYLDPSLRQLRLTGQEKLALLAFLRSLSGSIQEGTQRD